MMPPPFLLQSIQNGMLKLIINCETGKKWSNFGPITIQILLCNFQNKPNIVELNN